MSAMSSNISKLADRIQSRIDFITAKTKTVDFKLKFDGSIVTLQVSFDEGNELGEWFVCSVVEKKPPQSDEIIGIAIDYFDRNNYINYFIDGPINEHRYDKALKFLEIIFQEFRKQKLFILDSRFHVQNISVARPAE